MGPDFTNHVSILGVCCVALTAACGQASSTGGTGGTGGSSSSCGSSGGSSSGGSSSGGSTSGGSTSATGGGGNAGSAGSACPSKTCASAADCTPVSPQQDLLTDFSGLDQNTFHSASSTWWTEFFGGPYVYPAPDACTEPAPTQLTQELTADVWHVTGTVGTYSGFGLWFAPCIVDLSAYTGFSFSIAGDVGQSASLIAHVVTAANQVFTSDPQNPTCSPNTATCTPLDPERPGESCKPGAYSVSGITSASQTITVQFSDVTGGQPDDSPDRARVVGFLFELDWKYDYTAQDTYPVDFTIDDFALVP